MIESIKVSVVVPTYNRKDNLRRTLDGLARQTYPCPDFEVVVVSDGSTDGTAEMLDDYARSAPYTLRAFTQPNSGPSVARNRGFREAQNEVIVFLDDDVEPVPTFLSRHAGHHAQDQKVVILGPMSPDPAQASAEPVWIAWEHAKLQQTYDLFRPGGAYFGAPPGPKHFYSGNASVRRQWLEAVGGFNETFKRQEDVEMAVRMGRTCGLRFVFDFDADGLHRPSRTFESWIRIPTAYGSLDAQRVCKGDLARASVDKDMNGRNRGTKALVWISQKLPFSLPAIVALSQTVSRQLHKTKCKKPALALLSACYNTCYSYAFWVGLKAGAEAADSPELLGGGQTVPQ